MNNLTSGIKSFMTDFIEDESGLTAVEYAIAGGLVVGGMVGAFVTLGDNATGQIQTLSCAAAGMENGEPVTAAQATSDTSLTEGDPTCV